MNHDEFMLQHHMHMAHFERCRKVLNKWERAIKRLGEDGLFTFMWYSIRLKRSPAFERSHQCELEYRELEKEWNKAANVGGGQYWDE
jgi:hypothetical protein